MFRLYEYKRQLFSSHLRKLLKKSKNHHFKTPTETHLLSKNCIKINNYSFQYYIGRLFNIYNIYCEIHYLNIIVFIFE